MTREIYLFSSGSNLYMFISGIRQSLQHHHLGQCRLLNITFIQLPTLHNCFSLNFFDLIFLCLFVTIGFCLTFLDVNPISFNRFLAVMSQTVTPASIHFFFFFFFFFTYFVVHFLFSNYFVFSILTLWCLSWSTRLFSFFNHPISFIFAQNFRHNWLGTTNIFRHTSLCIAFLNELYNHFYCFNWQFFCWRPCSLSVIYT